MKIGHNRPGKPLLGLHRMQRAGINLGLQAGNFGRAQIRQQCPELPHQLIGNRHQLAVHLCRSLMNPDRIAKRLGHLLHAVQPFKNRRHQDDLRLLPILPLQFPAAQQVELLIGPSKFHIAFKRDRVIALHHRIQELVQTDRLFRFIALVKLIPLKHLRDGKVRRQSNRSLKPQLVEPFGIESYLGLIAIQNLENLRLVGFGILVDLLPSQRLARHISSGRVANQGGKVPDQKDHLMPKLLKMPELAHQYGVA